MRYRCFAGIARHLLHVLLTRYLSRFSPPISHRIEAIRITHATPSPTPAFQNCANLPILQAAAALFPLLTLAPEPLGSNDCLFRSRLIEAISRTALNNIQYWAILHVFPRRQSGICYAKFMRSLASSISSVLQAPRACRGLCARSRGRPPS